MMVITSCGGRTAVPPTIPPAWLTQSPTPVRVGASTLPGSADGLRATPTLAPGADTPVPAPTQPPAAEAATATPLPPSAQTAEPGALVVTAGPGIPASALAQLQQQIAANPALAWGDAASADVTLTADGGEPFARWVFAAVAPFATVPDGITLAELQSGSTAAGRLVLDDATAATFPQFNRQPAGSDLAAELWARRPAVGLLPFDQITPDLKLLRVDGQSPIAPDFAPDSYPLTVRVGLDGDADALAAFRTAWRGPTGNYDPAKLTRVALTGVTALVRATAYNMEINGILWPGTDIKPVLQAADIAHISNEVAFAPDCPYPNPIGGTTFCSRDSYFALLQDIGANLIELTGNHVNDWGPENLVRSIEMYEQAGMRTFGGGRTLVEAQQPATYDHNGNRIAFVGCNSFGPAFSWATESGAGSRPCDPDFAAQIGRLRSEGYLVIATLQYTEFYQYPPTPEQTADFRTLIDAGATAVSGSQGHHLQGFDFYNGGFIHYGPGNTFFDQMDQPGTRQTFVDTYIIYDNRLLTVDLWTGLIESYAKPRLMTPEERAQTLQTVFQASGW